MNRVGDIVTFKDENYELLENNIISRKKKTKFLIYMNLSAWLVIIIGVIINFVIFRSGSFELSFKSFVILVLYLIGFIVFAVIHELLHGGAFMLFGKVQKKDIAFGVVLKSGVAYCISKIPVTVKASRLSLMMPIYVICIPLYVIAIIINNFGLGLYTIILFSGSVGDIYYMWKLRKTDKNLYMFENMPNKSGYEIGYLLFKKL
jgi:hypothetical protein